MSYYYSYCYCRECLCMDLNDRNRYDKNEAWCSAWRKYFNPNDKACSRYFEYDPRKTGGGYYITTIICNILGTEKAKKAFKNIRELKDDYMLNHPETYPMLIEYDVVGPKIAKAINNDTNKLEIAKIFYDSYILPVTEDIKNKKYEEAIIKYQDMTNKLKNYYHIDTTIDRKLDIKIKTLGKARA